MKTSLEKTNEDWTFLDVSTREYTHGFHLYPARMHPEIAKRLIQKYAQDRKNVVFDPFMGSGGVLVEALLNNNNAVGIDVNPFAVLLSKVKTTPLNSENLKKIYEKIANNIKNDYKNRVFHDEVAPKSKSLNLKFWYKSNVVKKLQILKYHIFNLRDSDEKDFFKICFSLTSRKASNQRNSIYKIYRMSEEDLQHFSPDVFLIFDEVCQNNISNMSEFHNKTKTNNAKAFPLLGDSKNIEESFAKVDEILDDGKAHLVITSPPYGDHKTTVAYGQFSKHPGLWLGLSENELLTVDYAGLGGIKKINLDNLTSEKLADIIKQVVKKEKELEANKKPYRADDVYAYFHDLDKCLEQCSKYLKQGKSHLCFVVANRTVRRVKIPTDEIIVELGKKYGFRHREPTIYRTIANKAMSIKNAPENITNNSGETMTKESIVIMEY